MGIAFKINNAALAFNEKSSCLLCTSYMPFPGEVPAKNIRNIKMFLEHKAQKWSAGGEGVKLDLAYVNWNCLLAIIKFLSKPF